jgi:hypothetical protein
MFKSLVFSIIQQKTARDTSGGLGFEVNKIYALALADFLAAWIAEVLAARFLNLSSLPAVSKNFCLPV